MNAKRIYTDLWDEARKLSTTPQKVLYAFMVLAHIQVLLLVTQAVLLIAKARR